MVVKRPQTREQDMSPDYPSPISSPSHTSYPRDFSIQKLEQWKEEHIHVSGRAFAKQEEIPHATFSYWQRRNRALVEKHGGAAAFFETSEGLGWLHRVVVAAQFTLTQLAGGSIQNMTTFLRLSGLDGFVASSVGSQYAAIRQMEEKIADFGVQERTRLAENMPHKEVIVCEDETFHPEICLVALEASSGFILVERYAESRDAATWNQALEDGLQGLDVKVIHLVSDQAKALICHAKECLGVENSPDLFHIQHDLCKATSLPLASQLRAAQERALFAAQHEQTAAQQHLTEATARSERAHNAIVGLSEVYHPFSLQDGALQTSEQLAASLSEHFNSIEQVASQAQLSEACCERIQKAKKLLPRMLATLAFFWQIVMCRLHSARLSFELQHAILTHLLPAYYLKKVAARQRSAEKRKALSSLSSQLLSPWHERDGPFSQLDAALRRRIEGLALGCAELFVRASSPTEGRNAHLRQSHQGSHRLSSRRLAALTTIHNFFITRADGSTAAERFFEQKQRNLFEYLLSELNVPSRPAARRPKLMN